MLLTLGYEGTTIEDFITCLKQAGVKAVLDVRELPLSRKKGFSKKAFAEHLSKAGIRYIHMPELGCPKNIRNEYRQTDSWPNYVRKFLRYLKTQRIAVRQVADLALARKVCLVCFEADYTRCHRSLVSEAASKLADITVRHLKIGETVDRLQAAA